MDDTTWLALTTVLTVLGVLLTVLAWRRRGSASAVRLAGITLLFPAAYLTGTLPVVVDIGQAVGGWATRLVFSPVVWTGVGLAALGVVLILASSAMRERGRGLTAHRSGGAVGPGDQPAAVPPASGRPATARKTQEAPAPAKGDAPADDGMDDIEAILRKRGIS